MKVVMMFGKTLLVGVTLGVLLGGCASPTSEDDFGNSVRRMIEAQKYTPEEQTDRRLPSLDGPKAEASVEQYRQETGSSERLQTEMEYVPVGQQ